MRFSVTCSNPKTGQTHEFELDAHDRGEAEQEVLDAGLVVGRIEPADDGPAETPPPRPRGAAARREARQERRRNRIVARVVGGGGLVVIALAVLGTVLPGGGEAFTLHEIRASVQRDGAQVTIVNLDEFPWQNIVVDINGGLANHGYVLRRDILNPGQSITADLGVFVSDKGEHYDPAGEPLRQLRIICDIGDGRKALHTRRWSAPDRASVPSPYGLTSGTKTRSGCVLPLLVRPCATVPGLVSPSSDFESQNWTVRHGPPIRVGSLRSRPSWTR